MSIQARLKQARKKSGLNQIPFAQEFGVSQSAYANYERGATDLPIWLVVEICRKYGVSSDWLLLGRGEMEIGQSGQVLENAIFALQSFIVENGVTISPEKQARLVRFLVEDLAQPDEFDLGATHRYLKAAL